MQKSNQMALEFVKERAAERSNSQAFTLVEMNRPAIGLGYP
jgi:hypothetical protein